MLGAIAKVCCTIFQFVEPENITATTSLRVEI
jgi:hypothetical protein